MSLPRAIIKRKLAAFLTARLNQDHDSPMYGMVKMPSNPEGIIQDGTVMTALEDSLGMGALADFRDDEKESYDEEGALKLLKKFWDAVAETWPDAWALPPKKSRLTHAAGFRGMTIIMDAIVNRHRETGLPSKKTYKEELAALAPQCRWTEGSWKFGKGNERVWDSIQSTPKDVQALQEHLLAQYKKLVRAAATATKKSELADAVIEASETPKEENQ